MVLSPLFRINALTMAEYLTSWLEWESKFNVDSILEFHNAQYDTAHPTPATLVALVYTSASL